MRVLVDDVESGLTTGSLAEALSAVAAQMREQGRIVVEIEVDGRPCAGGDLDAVLTGHAGGATPAVVRMMTAEPREQVAETLAAAAAELGVADELQQQAAELIEAGDTAEGMDRLGQALAIWSGVQRATSLAGTLVELPIDAVSIDGVAGLEIVAALDRRLRAMADALATRDPVDLSDTLLYDMPVVTQQWRDLLAELQRMIRRQP